jgi:hypothetical protein
MISLADMNDVAVDPERATVAAQGGATWAELNAAAGMHGLAVTGGAVSTTGIAGLTLGGGLGWLMAKHGWRPMAPFRAFGSPLMAEVGPMPYPVMNTLLDGGFPAGALNYWLPSFTRGPPDALIDRPSSGSPPPPPR